MYVIVVVILAILFLCSCKKKTHRKKRRLASNPLRIGGKKIFKLNEIEILPDARPTYLDYPDFSKLTWASDSSHAKRIEGAGCLDNASGKGIITPMRQKKGDQTLKMASSLHMLRWQTE